MEINLTGRSALITGGEQGPGVCDGAAVRSVGC